MLASELYCYGWVGKVTGASDPTECSNWVKPFIILSFFLTALHFSPNGNNRSVRLNVKRSAVKFCCRCKNPTRAIFASSHVAVEFIIAWAQILLSVTAWSVAFHHVLHVIVMGLVAFVCFGLSSQGVWELSLKVLKCFQLCLFAASAQSSRQDNWT